MSDVRKFELDGVKYMVRRPTVDELIEANELRRKTFNEELKAGTILREELDQVLRQRDLWSDEREARYQQLRREILDGEYKLAKGGIKLSEAKKIALDIKKKRQEMAEMLAARSELDANTCEGKADAIRFNFLLCKCLVYEDSGEPVFKNGLAEYAIRQDEPVAVMGATEFFYLISDADNLDANLPENKFLRRFKFVNDKYQLVDEKGRLVDEEGRHIDEEGNYIKWISDTEYIKVDVNGHPLRDDNEYDVEPEPFLDDDGNPIILEDDENEEPKPKKRRTRRKKTEAETEVASEA